MADIGLTAPLIHVANARSARTTGTGCTYGKVVVADNGTNNALDVKLATAAKEQGVAGVVWTRDAAGTSGELIEIAGPGDICEVWLAAGETCTKEGEAICSADDGNVKPIGVNTGAMDVVGRFQQNATAGSDPIRVALKVGIYSKVVA